MKELTATQLAEWEAYNVVDPIGFERIEFNFGILCALISNALKALYGDKNEKATSPIDFMPDWVGTRDNTKEQQSIEQMKKILMALAGEKEEPV